MRNFYYAFLNLFSLLFRFLYKNRLIVLAYHDIKDQKIFTKHIQYLTSYYNVINISQLRRHLYNDEKLPEYPLLITFDDGDYSVFTKGIPVLKYYQAPACLFIITGLINTKKDFWWDVVYENGKKNNENIIITHQKVKRLKNISNLERLRILESYELSERKQLSTKELELLEANKISIGNHSHTHPMFDKCNPKEIIAELNNSYQQFLNWKIEGYDVFAYPNGNYDRLSEKILEKNNIKLAFLFDHKVNARDINPLRISRIRTNSDMNMSELKVKVSGIHSFLVRLIKIK